MIVSHEHRFIFIKTAKTAGSSIEEALKPLCGPDDIIARTLRSSKHPPAGSDNFRRGLGKLGIPVPAGIARHMPQLAGFYPHMPARHVRTLIGPEIWDSYFKFTVERNPWDRQISLYYYRYHKRKNAPSFEETLSPWFSTFHASRMRNWYGYTVDDRIIVDRIIRFENLDNDFNEISRQLGLGDLSLPHANSGPRRERAHYRDYYTPRTRDTVANWYAREIKALGYSF